MKFRSYIELMRLDKPIGIWLLFYPAAWAVTFSGGGDTQGLIVTMLFGAIITRAAGCILNDLTDRKLDAKVERTKHRPLASGAIKPWQAITLLVVLLLAALIIALTLPPAVFTLALVALPMIALYPWMKRITWWPQLFLGLTFNLGVLFGWVATGFPLDTPAPFVLYAACIFWTLGYDTIYAVQDMADDAKAGIRSTARRIGLTYLRQFVAACYGIMVALLALTGYLLDAPLPYYAALCITAGHLVWQVRQLPCTPEQAGVIFRSNQWPGLTLLVGLLLSRLL